jgi:hypothetical protein
LRTKLKKCISLGQNGNVGIFDPKAKGKCVKLLLVPCNHNNFYERVFDVLDIAKNCNLISSVEPNLRPFIGANTLSGVMFLPVSWNQSCERRLATHVSQMLRNYGVIQTCVKFPLYDSPRCWR